MRRSWRRLRLLLVLPLLALLAVGVYVARVTADNAPMPAAEAALASDETVLVDTEQWLVFRPAGMPPRTGFIFYPGGLVPAAAYAPAARAIAAEGYLAVIVPMPLNLAVTAPDRAQEVIAAYPEVERWAVGGHSLGGAMAARFAFTHPEAVDGLAFWASYPSESNDLSASDLRVVSVYGDRDGLATPSEVRRSRALLPGRTTFVEINGGNHTQFGYYGDGPQRGDNPAAVSREMQQAQAVAATVTLLDQLVWAESTGDSSP